MKWINAKQETPRPDADLLLLSNYENTYYYTALKGWGEIEDIRDEYGIAWSELPKHPYQDSTGWNVITDTPFAELDFEDEALVYFKHEDYEQDALKNTEAWKNIKKEDLLDIDFWY